MIQVGFVLTAILLVEVGSTKPHMGHEASVGAVVISTLMVLQVKVPVCVFAFDCLYVDGETLLKEPLEARRARMAAALPNMQPGFVCLAFSHRLQVRHLQLWGNLVS